MELRDDECRVRTNHAPANFCTIKHMVQNLIRLAPGKASPRLKRKTAGWDGDFLASLITVVELSYPGAKGDRSFTQCISHVRVTFSRSTGRDHHPAIATSSSSSIRAATASSRC